MAGVDLFKEMVTDAVLLDAFVIVSLDFERPTFLDSSGLGALLAAKKVADEQGIQLNFINVPAVARRCVRSERNVEGSRDRVDAKRPLGLPF